MTRVFTHKALIYKTNYTPFGVVLEQRDFSSSAYRHGFNGIERDDEVKGSGNSYDFGARLYDSRLGRFLRIDPLNKNYPFWAPFSYSGNSPIFLYDFMGLGPGTPTDGGGTFTTPDGGSIQLPAGSKPLDFSDGFAILSGDPVPSAEGCEVSCAENSLMSFESPDGRVFEARFNSEDGRFTGYYHDYKGLNEEKITYGNSRTVTSGITYHFPDVEVASTVVVSMEESPITWNPAGQATIAITAGLATATTVIAVAVTVHDYQMTMPDVREDGYTGRWVDPSPRVVYQYALLCTREGPYPVYSWGASSPTSYQDMSIGDIWKIGITMNPQTRYPQHFYYENGLQMDIEFEGTLWEASMLEKMKIVQYYVTNGDLPPGNKGIK